MRRAASGKGLWLTNSCRSSQLLVEVGKGGREATPPAQASELRSRRSGERRGPRWAGGALSSNRHVPPAVPRKASRQALRASHRWMSLTTSCAVVAKTMSSSKMTMLRFALVTSRHAFLCASVLPGKDRVCETRACVLQHGHRSQPIRARTLLGLAEPAGGQWLAGWEDAR